MKPRRPRVHVSFRRWPFRKKAQPTRRGFADGEKASETWQKHSIHIALPVWPSKVFKMCHLRPVAASLLCPMTIQRWPGDVFRSVWTELLSTDFSFVRFMSSSELPDASRCFTLLHVALAGRGCRRDRFKRNKLR